MKIKISMLLIAAISLLTLIGCHDRLKYDNTSVSINTGQQFNSDDPTTIKPVPPVPPDKKIDKNAAVFNPTPITPSATSILNIPIKFDVPKSGGVAWDYKFGVPFAPHELPHASNSKIYAAVMIPDGRIYAADADITSTYHWMDGSIRWLLIHTRLPAIDSNGASGTLMIFNSDPSEKQVKKIKVTDNDDHISVDTGAVSFVVSKKRGSFFEKIAFDKNNDGTINDDETVYKAPQTVTSDNDIKSMGTYWVGRTNANPNSDAVYSSAACKPDEAEVEYLGRQKAIIHLAGWYCMNDNPSIKSGKYVVRIEAMNGSPDIKIQHTWIQTEDTWQKISKYVIAKKGIVGRGGKPIDIDIDYLGRKIDPNTKRPIVVTRSVPASFSMADLVFTIPVSTKGFTPSEKWHLGQDDAVGPTYPFDGKARTITQTDSNHYIINASVADGKLSGDLDIDTSDMYASVSMHDFWREYPKAMEVGKDIKLHLWAPTPERDAVENPNMENFHQLWFVHSGSRLTFKIPQVYMDLLGEKDAVADPNILHDANALKISNARGVAKTHSFIISFGAKATDTARSNTHELQPMVHATAEWMVDSGVFGYLSVENKGQHPKMENYMEELFDKLTTIHEHVTPSGDYGMFVFGNGHSYMAGYEPSPHYNMVLAAHWHPHRTWRSWHHGAPRIPWTLYARSGKEKYLRWGKLHTQFLLDLGVAHVNLVDKKGNPLPVSEIDKRYSYWSRKYRGGLTDYKGITPWHAGRRNPDYNLMLDNVFWDYHLTGNMRAMDVADEILGLLLKNREQWGPNRAVDATLSTLLTAYKSIDPEKKPNDFERLKWMLYGTYGSDDKYYNKRIPEMEDFRKTSVPGIAKWIKTIKKRLSNTYKV